MFEYDKEKNILTVYKVKNIPVDLDLLEDQKKSYNKYITETIYKDMEYLLEELKRQKGLDNLTIDIKVGNLTKTTYKRDIKKLGNCFYPVTITFHDGVRTMGPYRAFRIPYLDDFCKLNVDGRRKVVINEQRPAEDISFDQKKKALYITMPFANVTIFVSDRSGIQLKYEGTKRYPLDKVIRAMLYRDNVTLPNDVTLPEYFSNYYLLGTMDTNKYIVNEIVYKTVSKTSILDKFESEQYALGEARDALNSFLSIDTCLGEVLSRDIGGYEAGTMVTHAILQDFHKNKINEVYVKDIPHIDGMYIENPRPLCYDVIPVGTKNCNFLREMFPEYKNLSYLKETIYLDPMQPIHLDDNHQITKDELEFLYIMGEREITCRRSKARNKQHPPVTYRFEREIVGNYTERLKNLLPSIPDGRSADEWVYYYNNPNYDRVDDSHLNVHDLMAIMSMLARVHSTGENPLLNRDDNYLKKVNMINETFSEKFHMAAREYISKYSRILNEMISGRTQQNPFFGLTDMWRHCMTDARLLAEADTVNVAAEVTQVSHISTVVNDSNSVVDEMRGLAVPFYGRICPYETPAGKKLGLVNTKAIGAHVFDGKLKAPYRRVIPTSDGIRLSNKVEYLSSKEEMTKKIGDILSLKQDENGKYLNTKVLASIPNPDMYGDKVIMDKINSFELDYVNAHTEQHLSPTAALMPCLSSNDAVRVSFGLNMIRQCIYLQLSQAPIVRTFMYSDIFKYSNAFLVRAEKSGMVMSIDTNSMTLMYDGDDKEVIIEVPETRITNDTVTFLNYRVTELDRFNAGDILVDSCVSREGVFSPARNSLVAYISTGWNYEDAVETSVLASTRYISISNNTVERTIPRSKGASTTIGTANRFKYISDGGVITHLNSLDNNDEMRSRKDVVRSGHYNGIFYDTDRYVEDNGNITYRCYLLGFNRLERGDKMAGRHGNKGVISKVTPNSEVPHLQNGRPVDFILNPLGVPSRMNVGQIDEAHIGLAAEVCSIKVNSDPFNGASLEDIRYMLEYAYDVANSKDDNELSSIQSRYTKFPKEFHDHVREHIEEARDWAGCFDKNGDAILWDPTTETNFEFPITIGISYFMKLVHEASHKIHVRAGMLEEQYSMVNKQPPKGARRGGGQRMGEMELCAIAAYGAQAYLSEIMNEKSDNAGARANAHMEILGYDARVPDKYCVPRAVESLLYMLEGVGVHANIDTDEVQSIDAASSMLKFTIDARAMIKKRSEDKNYDPRKTTDDIANELDEATL